MTTVSSLTHGPIHEFFQHRLTPFGKGLQPKVRILIFEDGKQPIQLSVSPFGKI
jgi:hypothetical protein